MSSKSFVHGTAEGAKHCKPMCVACSNFIYGGDDSPIAPPPTATWLPPDILAFLAAGRFNHLSLGRTDNDEWRAEIVANGDKFMGFGPRPDYAMFVAIRRYDTTLDGTGPITHTVDQRTQETSQGHGLDPNATVPIERVWQDDESNTSLPD